MHCIIINFFVMALTDLYHVLVVLSKPGSSARSLITHLTTETSTFGKTEVLLNRIMLCLHFSASE